MTKTMCCYLTIGNDNNNNMNSKLLQRKNVKKNRFVPEICVTFILYTSRNLNSYTHREAERERERVRSTLQMHISTPKYMPAVEIKANNYSFLSRLVVNTLTHPSSTCTTSQHTLYE